ncbi:MAG: pyruvate kinase [Acidimicrobiia bacterium]|jgi:pyruvate kinase|nr:pyruvate kinase [Acidimicrobiia bacterium]
MRRRTKIVATLGPASETPDTVRQLIIAGVDVARINLSHGPLDQHLGRLATVRRVADEVGKPVAVLADLPGPKIRAGSFPPQGTILATDDLVRLVPGTGDSDHEEINVDYPALLTDVGTGERVIIGDGAVVLEVLDVDDHAVTAVVRNGARMQGSPGVHLVCEALISPTPEDCVLADAVANAGVDFIAVSFVRHADDVSKIRDVVGARARLVAKVETRAAVENLADIAKAADAVMVARGDLGIDCPLEDVPHMQKRIIRHCVEHGVPVITATQMLETMVNASSPTRAEVSDIANAVFDGTDALMLSAETAIGHDPVLVVRTMASIAARAEAEASYHSWGERLASVERLAHLDVPGRTAAAMTHAAWQAARDIDAAAILCCTRSGRTAIAMARFRPEAKLVGLSPDPGTVRALQLSWGVTPMRVDTYSSTDEMVWFATERATGSVVMAGDLVVVLAGAPGGPGDWSTDVLRIVKVL